MDHSGPAALSAGRRKLGSGSTREHLLQRAPTAATGNYNLLPSVCEHANSKPTSNLTRLARGNSSCSRTSDPKAAAAVPTIQATDSTGTWLQRVLANAAAALLLQLRPSGKLINCLRWRNQGQRCVTEAGRCNRTASSPGLRMCSSRGRFVGRLFGAPRLAPSKSNLGRQLVFAAAK